MEEHCCVSQHRSRTLAHNEPICQPCRGHWHRVWMGACNLKWSWSPVLLMNSTAQVCSPACLLPLCPNAAGRNRCIRCWLQTGGHAGTSKWSLRQRKTSHAKTLTEACDNPSSLCHLSNTDRLKEDVLLSSPPAESNMNCEWLLPESQYC